MKISRAFWLATVVACLIPIRSQIQDEEPPLGVVLELGDDRYELMLGESIDIHIGDVKIPVKISASPTRHFDFDGLSFDYPSQLAFSIDRAPGVTLWSLDGSDCILMVQRFAAIDPPELLETMVESIRDQLGVDPIENLPVEIELLGKVTSGRSLRIELAGSQLHQEIYALEAAGSSWILLIQDSLNDAGEATEETKLVKAVLQRTIAARK